MTSRDTFHPFADSGGITMQEKSEGLNVARLRELEAAATPGPWRHSGSDEMAAIRESIRKGQQQR